MTLVLQQDDGCRLNLKTTQEQPKERDEEVQGYICLIELNGTRLKYFMKRCLCQLRPVTPRPTRLTHVWKVLLKKMSEIQRQTMRQSVEGGRDATSGRPSVNIYRISTNMPKKSASVCQR